MKNICIHSVDMGFSQFEHATPASTHCSYSNNINSTGTSFADLDESVVVIGKEVVCVKMKQHRKQKIKKKGGK